LSIAPDSGPRLGRGPTLGGVSTLHLELEPVGRAVVVRASGELDAYVAPELGAALRDQAEDTNVDALVLDLSRVTFLDSAALGAIVGARRSMRERGGELRVVPPLSAAARIFELTSLDRVLELYPSTERALAGG
jgi:anti-sigma B factor antagonist